MTTASRRTASRGLLLAAILAVLPSAPTAAGAPGDPFEKVNRATYAFNDALDRVLARPAARAYVAAVPAPIRKAVSNFVENLTYPEVIINNALQGKFKDAGSDVARLVINTVVGIGGLGDPATGWGFQAHDEDFGQTLGHWGVPPGPYVMLPVIGPSDLRDGPAKLVDTYSNPYSYVNSNSARYGLSLLTLFSKRVELLAADSAVRNAYDPYVFVRNAYVARRNYLVHDGNVPEDNFDDPLSAAPAVPAIEGTRAPTLAAAGDEARPDVLAATDGADARPAPGANLP